NSCRIPGFGVATPKHLRQSKSSSNVSSRRLKCCVLVDFDGTIATVDTTDALLERFAEPGWHEIEAEWQAGRIGSRECLVRQIDLIKATPEAYDEFVASIQIDPGFLPFIAECKARDLDV